MSTTPDTQEQHPDRAVDSDANEMKDQLRKDVASWSAAQSGALARQTAEDAVPVARQPARRSRPQTAASPEIKPASAAKKPFRMSYDGVSDADYISYMLARGAR
jgi:hypothetical protein